MLRGAMAQNSTAPGRSFCPQDFIPRKRQLADQPIWFHRICKPWLGPPPRNARADRPQVNLLPFIIKKWQFSTWFFQTTDQIANLRPSWLRIPVSRARVEHSLSDRVPLALIKILDHSGVQSARSGFTQHANQIQILNLCAKSSKSQAV